MNTRMWAAILSVLLVVSIGLCFLPKGQSDTVRVLCDGELLQTISLKEDGEYTIKTRYGTNVLEVRDGAIAVISADCPGNDCVHMGYRRGGMSIVCLPNRLVLEFAQSGDLDGISG